MIVGVIVGVTDDVTVGVTVSVGVGVTVPPKLSEGVGVGVGEPWKPTTNTFQLPFKFSDGGIIVGSTLFVDK